MLSATKDFLTHPTAKTYYVSPTGSDSNNGLTPGAAFATPAAALTAAGPASTILLQRGGTWNLGDDSTFSGITIATNGITLGSYGSGALPIIDRGTEPTGAVFNDGFESETSAFDTNYDFGKVVAGGSTVTLDTTDPISGTQSMMYTHASGGSGYVTKLFTESGVFIQFKVKIETLVNGSSGNTTEILQLLGPGGCALFLVQDTTPKRGVQVLCDAGGVNITPPIYYQQGQILRIEFQYLQGTGANGVAQCWVNGALIASNLACTATASAAGIRLGNFASGTGGLGAGSQLLFDDVKLSTTALGVGARGDHGIAIQGNDVKVQDIEVRNTAVAGVWLDNCNRATVQRASLHDHDSHGILASAGGGNHTVSATEIWFCGLAQSTYGVGSATQLLDTTIGVNTFINCYIHHSGGSAGDHGIYSEGGANLFVGNIFREIEGFAVKTNEGSAGTTVLRNQMISCKAGGVQVNTSTEAPPLVSPPVNIYHNSLYLCGPPTIGESPLTAFFIGNYGAAKLLNNASSGSAYAIEVDLNGALSSSNNNDLTFAFSFGWWQYTSGVTAEATLANWQTASGLDANSIVADPMYTDPDAANLTLQVGSPCINAGQVIAGINDGYLGSAPDIGYLEAA